MRISLRVGNNLQRRNQLKSKKLRKAVVVSLGALALKRNPRPIRRRLAAKNLVKRGKIGKIPARRATLRAARSI